MVLCILNKLKGMMHKMNNIYEVKKNIEKLKRGKPTNFLSPNIYKQIFYKLKKHEYKIYYPYPDSDKIILYANEIPKITLFEINSYYPLTHSEILGSLFGLNITNEVFGDIIINNDEYYFYATNEISDFIKNNLYQIGNKPITLKEVNIETLKNYQRKYQELSLITSSLRIDTIISKIIKINRTKIKELIKSKSIILNYEVLSNNSYLLKENDIFSIKKFGKYKFIGIEKKTKKDNYIVKYYKYL